MNLIKFLALKRQAPNLLRALFAAAPIFLLAACSNNPPVPDWQLNAKSSSERFVNAYMSGNSRIEALEFQRARYEVSSTGRIDLVAKIELLRCAAQVASLVFEPCAGFERLRQDASPADGAYADYLAGTLQATDAALLPAPQRAVAGGAAASVAGITDPLSQLVAAGVLMRSGKANPVVMQQAADTASAQGWRRPLLAWLGAQVLRAEQGGDAQEAARLQRRRDVASETAPGTRAVPRIP